MESSGSADGGGTSTLPGRSIITRQPSNSSPSLRRGPSLSLWPSYSSERGDDIRHILSLFYSQTNTKTSSNIEKSFHAGIDLVRHIPRSEPDCWTARLSPVAPWIFSDARTCLLWVCNHRNKAMKWRLSCLADLDLASWKADGDTMGSARYKIASPRCFPFSTSDRASSQDDALWLRKRRQEGSHLRKVSVMTVETVLCFSLFLYLSFFVFVKSG